MAAPIGNFQLELQKKTEALSSDVIKSLSNIKTEHLVFNEVLQLSSVDDISWIRAFFDNCDSLHRKSNSQAVELRNEGNKYFQKKLYREALDKYTEAIFQADSNMVDLALAYGNRSATLFRLKMYRECLSDVSAALQIEECPTDKRPKLLIRRANCFIHLQQMDELNQCIEEVKQMIASMNMESKDKDKLFQEINAIEELETSKTIGEDENVTPPTVIHGYGDVIVQASCAVHLQHTQHQGRFLVASKTISPGDTLIVETPYAAVLLPEHYNTHCHHCFVKIKVAYPCRQCTRVKYCSTQCSEDSWQLYHHIECLYLPLLHSVGIAHLSLRIVLTAGLQFLNNFDTDSGDVSSGMTGLDEEGRYCCNYLTVYNLLTHLHDINGEDIFQYTMTAQLLLKILQHADWFSKTRKLCCPDNQSNKKPSDCDNKTENPCCPDNQSIKKPSDCDNVVASDKKDKIVIYSDAGQNIIDSGKNFNNANCSLDKNLTVSHEYSQRPNPTADTNSSETTTQNLSHEEGSLRPYTAADANSNKMADTIATCAQTMGDLSLSTTAKDDTVATTGNNDTVSTTGKNDTSTTGKNDTVSTTSKNDTVSTTGKNDTVSTTGNNGTVSTSSNNSTVTVTTNDDTVLTDQLYIGGLLLRHILQLVCNAHAITDLQCTQLDSQCNVEDKAQVRIATAVYPTASLMNHSCDPTIISSFYKNTLVVRATKHVDVGAEIFNCYGPHFRRMDFNERQRCLKEQYFFTCNCTACASGQYTEDIYNSFQCMACAGPATRNQNNAVTCSLCNKESKINMTAINKIDDLFQMGCSMLNQNKLKEAKRVMLECYTQAKKIFYKHNKQLSEITDCVGRCYAMLGEFDEAVKYVKESLLTVEIMFDVNSIEVGNELQKLSELLISAQDWVEALKVTDRACRIFELNYGKSHDSVRNLSAARKELKDVVKALRLGKR